MEDAELAKKLLQGIGKKKAETDTEDLLNDIKDTRTASLKEVIDEILDQIKLRERLHKEMMDDIEKLKSSINNMTMSLTPSPDNMKVMVEFQKKLIEAEEMKVQEKLNCFRDIAQLKKELREWIKELGEKEKRASLLGELLSEEN